MKTNHFALILFVACLGVAGCNTQPSTSVQSAPIEEVSADGGQSTVDDYESQKNVVHVAVSSADHSTLVEAVKAAELVDALSNAGPFTVFAPVNTAFEKLPAGTVEGLLKPDQKTNLQDILEYHVAVGVYKTENLRDGQVLGMVNGDNVTFAVSDGKVTVNGANIIASLPASNGVIHVIDAVLLPK